MWHPKLIVLQPTPYCNIRCDYCYLRHRDDRTVMGAEVVRAIRDKIIVNIAPDAAPTIIWHAGEPTVVSLDWYRQAYGQLRPAAPIETRFSLQSNGVFLSEDWISFLKETDTHIGLSIDGPRELHDLRRKTRSGKGTWAHAIRTLRKLQDAGIDPSVVSVLHPNSLTEANEYFEFYRDNAITHVSFSIDEAEGAHEVSSFAYADHKAAITDFLFQLLRRAFAEQYPLHIKEVERIADVLTNGALHNEQIEPWDVIVVGADGGVTTFSPEFTEIRSREHNDFRFGNVLRHDFEALVTNPMVAATRAQIANGIERCRTRCGYFAICGGGAPANKFQETGSLEATETVFCRLSIQAAAEALRAFLEWSAASCAGGQVGLRGAGGAGSVQPIGDLP